MPSFSVVISVVHSAPRVSLVHSVTASRRAGAALTMDEESVRPKRGKMVVRIIAGREDLYRDVELDWADGRRLMERLGR
jgi:hypothetical protein